MKDSSWLVLGLCVFIALLNFKPSEPYLSQFLVCNKYTCEDDCSENHTAEGCNSSPPCSWTGSYCDVLPCSSVLWSDCGNEDYDYCTKSGGTCSNSKCFTHFSEYQVNDDIYPWSTYAYLPFLILMGPYAELFSYRIAILFGICGRLVTRFLLIYGRTIQDMQLMQVSYALGTAAEDVLFAYLYYVLPPARYQFATSSLKATQLFTNVVAGVVGDLMVIEGDVSLISLMWISAVSVAVGFMVGIAVLQGHRVQDERQKVKDVGEADETDGTESDLGGPLISNHDRREENSALELPYVTPRPLNFAEKLRLFREQLKYLRVIVRCRELLNLMVFWVVGNAVFMVLYNYEVAIYAELNNHSNEWNGCVLAIMLLAGALGAVLPTYVDNWYSKRDAASPALQLKMRDAFVGLQITVASTLSCLFVALFVWVWSLVASVAFLAMFFATWQYIQVVGFAQLALALSEEAAKDAKSSHIPQETEEKETGSENVKLFSAMQSPTLNETGPTSPSNVETPPPEAPFSMAIVVIVALNVVVQTVLTAITFSGLQLSLRASCWVFAFTFVVCAGLYIAVACVQFGRDMLNSILD